MIFIKSAALLALALSGGAHAIFGDDHDLEKRQTPATRVCDAGSGMCFAQFTTAANQGGIRYRFAVQESATTAAPYDIFLQIVAPKAQTWAGVAWGGSMTYNPLLVAWPNGNTVVTSSRFTATKSLPQPYAGSTYKTLSSSSNASYWELNAVCSGCSHWLEDGSPNRVPTNGATFAYAASTRPVTTPSTNTSNFAVHQWRGFFNVNLEGVKTTSDVWSRHIAALRGGAARTVPRQENSTSTSLEPSTVETVITPTPFVGVSSSVETVSSVTSAAPPTTSEPSSTGSLPTASSDASTPAVSSSTTEAPVVSSTASSSSEAPVVSLSSEAPIVSSTSEPPVVSSTSSTSVEPSSPTTAAVSSPASSFVPDTPFSASTPVGSLVPTGAPASSANASTAVSRSIVPDTPLSSGGGGGISTGSMTTVVRTFAPDQPFSGWPTPTQQQTQTQQVTLPTDLASWWEAKAKWIKGKWAGKKGKARRRGVAIPEGVVPGRGF